MQAAATRVTAAGMQGSSTCCIVLLDTQHGRLASANIGDSGFMILGVTPNNAKPHVKFRTPQQEHQFGCPYQLGHHAAADPPEDAMLTTLPVSCCFLLRTASYPRHSNPPVSSPGVSLHTARVVTSKFDLIVLQEDWLHICAITTGLQRATCLLYACTNACVHGSRCCEQALLV